MKLTQQSLSMIESAIAEAVGKFEPNTEQPVVTDIHLQPDSVSGQLNIYDDNDRELASVVVEEWVDQEGDDFMDSVEPALHDLLVQMKRKGCFDRVAVLKPYSFVLVDEEKETVAELLLMDDDALMLDDDLLKNLDKELDDFLDDLLKE